jgi:hypothetical protein
VYINFLYERTWLNEVVRSSLLCFSPSFPLRRLLHQLTTNTNSVAWLSNYWALFVLRGNFLRLREWMLVFFSAHSFLSSLSIYQNITVQGLFKSCEVNTETAHKCLIKVSLYRYLCLKSNLLFAAITNLRLCEALLCRFCLQYDGTSYLKFRCIHSESTI